MGNMSCTSPRAIQFNPTTDTALWPGVEDADADRPERDLGSAP